MLEPSYKKPNRTYTNRYGIIWKIRQESVSSTTYSDTSKRSGKCIKMYVYHPKDRLKLKCIIHGPGNALYECKVLGNFGSKYAKDRPTKYHRKENKTKKKFGRHQENTVIVQHEVDKIIAQEKETLRVKDETHENIDYEVDKEDMYELGKMSLDQK